MNKLTRDELYTLEAYSRERDQMRARVMAHKIARRLSLGPIVNLYFEDRLTMQYQVQEMLRAERIFESDAIQEELDAYNPLIPDGTNWKATMMIEVPDPERRARELSRLVGIEDRVYVQVLGFDPVVAIADEDLDRSMPDKTSSVHFLRFEPDPGMIAALRGGSTFAAGIDHDEYRHEQKPVPEALRAALLADLD